MNEKEKTFRTFNGDNKQFKTLLLLDFISSRSIFDHDVEKAKEILLQQTSQ